MKVGYVAVFCSLLLVQSASAILVTIDRQVTTPTFLSFDVVWNTGDTSSSDLIFYGDGDIMWRALGRDNFPNSLRRIDIFVEGHDFTLSDSWDFHYDEQGLYVPDQPLHGSPSWGTRTFNLLDPSSARVTYAVPEPSVFALGALFAGLYAAHRKLQQ